jgi:hypothetical protein
LQVEHQHRILDHMKIPVRMTLSLTLLILLLAAATASAAEGETGILYGDSHACFVTAPPGWVLDNRSGLRDRVHAAFYPEGSSWRDSSAVMYANGVTRSPGETLDSFITDDIQTFRSRAPQIQIKEGPSIKTKDGRIALVRYFSGDQSGNHEAVAYVAEKRAIIVLALSARSQDAYQRSLQSFGELVRNYSFISDHPKDEVNHFDLIQMIADDQSHTPLGKSYDGACGVYFAQRHAKSIDACFGSVPIPNLSPFDVLVRVTSSGGVEKIISRPKTNMSNCLVEAMNGDTFPIPPTPDYWWHLHMIIAPRRRAGTPL